MTETATAPRRRGRPRKNPEAQANSQPAAQATPKPAKAEKVRPQVNRVDELPADIRVHFSGVSIGMKTARVSIAFARSYMSPEQAAGLFVERRLIGKIAVVREDEELGQLTFLPDDRPAIDNAFDVTQFSVTAEHFKTGLTVRKQSVDMAILSEFANKSGILRIESAGQIEDTPGPDEAELDDHDSEDEGAPE